MRQQTGEIVELKDERSSKHAKHAWDVNELSKEVRRVEV
jgi:hypothetical protein